MDIQKIKYNKKDFEKLLSSGKVWRIVDTVESQLDELFLIRNPKFRYVKDYNKELTDFLNVALKKKKIEEFGNWFFFEWSRLLVHFLPEDSYFELRTARNKNLILRNEQEKFYNYKVGIAGLSIGSHAAYTLAMMGGAKTMKLADPDVLSGSNLNRVRYDATQIGEKKIDLASRGIYQVNPYSEIISYSEGLTEKNIDDFIIRKQKIDVLVEEVDNLFLKFLLRFAAKRNQVPVIMATDNGDNVIVDIERYDLEPDLPIFNGLVGDITQDQFKEIPKETLPLFVGNIVGIDLVTPRVFESLAEVGKTLYSWPQLGSAANMSGSILAYIVRQLAIGVPLKSGKYDINIEKTLIGTST